jgi:hypothetical protein
MWQEVVMAYLEVLHQRLAEATKETIKNPQVAGTQAKM